MEGVVASRPSVSLIVPTYREAESLPLLLDRLGDLRTSSGIDLELLIMDDNSRDGTEELVRSRNLPWVTLVVRTSDRGLSPSVVDGFGRAGKDVIIVMDADLSHPPERIPDLLEALAKGNEFVIGSRYVPGASTDEAWGAFRWLNSKVATLLARPFTALRDPMSGFFAFRRDLLGRSDPLQAIGYKIGLEVLVKSRVTKAAEIPIHFAQRQKGESKLSLKEQLRYVRHLGRLFDYKYPRLVRAAGVLLDAALGLLATLAAAGLGLALHGTRTVAVAAGVLAGLALTVAVRRVFRPAFLIGVLLGGVANAAAAESLLTERPGVGWPLAVGAGALAGAIARIVVEVLSVRGAARLENPS